MLINDSSGAGWRRVRPVKDLPSPVRGGLRSLQAVGIAQNAWLQRREHRAWNQKTGIRLHLIQITKTYPAPTPCSGAVVGAEDALGSQQSPAPALMEFTIWPLANKATLSKAPNRVEPLLSRLHMGPKAQLSQVLEAQDELVVIMG